VVRLKKGVVNPDLVLQVNKESRENRLKLNCSHLQPFNQFPIPFGCASYARNEFPRSASPNSPFPIISKMLVLVQMLNLTAFANRNQRCLRAVTAVALLLTLASCTSVQPTSSDSWESPELPPTTNLPTPKLPKSTPSLPKSTANRELLEESWNIYRQQFIQADGRVIDYQDSDRSTSEGQAYAMLRAIIIDDPTTFALTLDWAEKNLHRLSDTGVHSDQLWAWKWGQSKPGKWGPIDKNFASDADIDAITALILASRRWNQPEYLKLARRKLKDLWYFSTIEVPGGKRYLLPGPAEAFSPTPTTIYLNPSYFAPYAFRLFAQVDKDRDWMSLVKSSYEALQESSKVSAVGLPSDWIALDTQTGKFQAIPAQNNLQSVYSFDAYRVWWRVAWDAAWFNAPEAEKYLRTATKHLEKQWREQKRLPARIDLQGKPTVNYEATSQYAMLYPAFRLINPDIAEQLLQEKLLTTYQQGIWDDQSAYYTQNLAWIGILSPSVVDPQLLQPQSK
jgi:endoglucanase